MSWKEKAKTQAVFEALKHVKNGQVLGLGSGSTAAIAVRELGSRIRKGELKEITAVPTSSQTFLLAVENGVPMTTLYEHPRVDLTIDGADQVDPHLNLIKGMGGALTREKIVASASKQLIIVVDETKLAEQLGKNQVVPLEVLPFAAPFVSFKLQTIRIKGRIREGTGKVGPTMTDNGNFIVDADAGTIETPRQLDAKLKTIPGVVETGLFIEMADAVYVGGKKGVKKLTR